MKMRSFILAVVWNVAAFLASGLGSSWFAMPQFVGCYASETAPTPANSSAQSEANGAANSHAAADEYAKEIRAFLISASRPPADMTAAVAHYGAAQALRPNDPRLYHAAGLVWLRQSKCDWAIAKFQCATKMPGPLYVAGWQSLIRLQAATNKHTDALETLVALAKSLERAEASYPCQPSKEDCAEWMGRMVTWLQMNGKTEPQKAAIAKADSEIQSSLAVKHRENYKNGKQRLFPTAVFSPIVPTPLDKIREEQRLVEIEEAKTLSQERLSKMSFAERLASLDKELDELALRYQELCPPARQIAASIAALAKELARPLTSRGVISKYWGLMRSHPNSPYSPRCTFNRRLNQRWTA